MDGFNGKRTAPQRIESIANRKQKQDSEVRCLYFELLIVLNLISIIYLFTRLILDY